MLGLVGFRRGLAIGLVTNSKGSIPLYGVLLQPLICTVDCEVGRQLFHQKGKTVDYQKVNRFTTSALSATLMLLKVCIISFFSVGLSQEFWGKLTNSVDYYGIENNDDIYTFASDQEANDKLALLMRFTGLPANFIVRAANVDNAIAEIRDGERYIFYSQQFMQNTDVETNTTWASVSILAHEIGHHLAGHTLKFDGSRPPIELEADRFSGYVLYRMGATLEEAQAAMKLISSDVGSDTHPPKSARLAAIANGWYEARDLDPDPIKDDDSNPPDETEQLSNVASNDQWTPVETVDAKQIPMVQVPPGILQMGSNEGDTDEYPVTEVEVEGFWIDKTEVTRGSYALCVADGVCASISTDDYSSRGDQPINNVTWYRAATFCRWRGENYRLPTEAEWEYAARGPSGWTYPWGNQWDSNFANSGEATSTVTSYPQGASWVGALDMAGNLWEWTSSVYLSYPLKNDGRNLIRNETDVGGDISIRGGSFLNPRNSLQSAYRGRSSGGSIRRDFGFRCARFNSDF